MEYMDVVGPAVAMLGGGRVRPWAAVRQRRKEGVSPDKAAMEHKCPLQLAIREWSFDHPKPKGLLGEGRLWAECGTRSNTSIGISSHLATH